MAQPRQVRTIKPGYWVALTLEPDSAPGRVFVGEVQDVDDHGIRITLLDWLLGMATSWDFFAPWPSIRSALVATPDHDVPLFGKEASKWQAYMEPDDSEESKA